MSTVAFRGTRAALVGNNTYLVRTIEVSELTNYLFSGRVRASVAGARAEAGLSFWDGNGVWIEDRVRTLQPGTSYEAFQLAFTAPVAARTVSVWILTGANGEYVFRTIKPVPYKPRTPHIHLAVKIKGKKELITQCYIKGHELNANDMVYKGIKDAAQRESVTLAFDPLKGSKAGELSARWDVVLGFTPEG